MRALKLATVAQFDKFESDSQNLLCCYDNELLIKKKKFYRELQNSGKLIWGANQKDKEEGDNQNESGVKKKSPRNESEKTGKKKRKVIASRNFLFNAKNNDHRIIKTPNNIFVLNVN